MKKALAANFLGRGWMALLALVATPLYVHFLGIECYGLIGFYNSLCAFFSIVDLGLGETFCREIARLFAHNSLDHKNGNSLRTLEIIYWACGAILSICIILFSPMISSHWLHTSLNYESTSTIIGLMGISFFFLWPFIFYSKGLQGMQAHLLNNTVLFIATSVRYGGSLAILYFYPTLAAFFYWQIISSCFQTLLALSLTWRKLYRQKIRARFSLKSLQDNWRFNLSMGLIGITSVILQQSDKLLASHFFSLEILGYYCFASTAASSLYYLVHPLGQFYYPRFIELVEKKNYLELKTTYQAACKLAIAFCAPFALLLILFGKKIVLLWTQDPLLAAKSAPLISLLSCGIFLNCCMTMPFYMHFATGDTKRIVLQNIFFFCLLVPFSIGMEKWFGPQGLASFYIVLNLGYLVFNVPRLNKKIAIA